MPGFLAQRFLPLSLVVLCLAFTAGELQAGEAGDLPSASANTAAELRADFLLNLPLATHWPVMRRDGNAKFRLCSLGDSEVTPAVKERLMGLDAAHASFEPDVSVYQLPHCDILYVPEDESQSFMRLYKKLAGLPVVTVGESDFFLHAGGMIAIMRPPLDGGAPANEIAFRICTHNAEAGGIRFDGMLLELAETVAEAQP